MTSQTDKSPIRLQRFDELEFLPRFEYGDMVESTELCGLTDGTRLGTGFGWMKLSIPDLAKIIPFNYWNCSFFTTRTT